MLRHLHILFLIFTCTLGARAQDYARLTNLPHVYINTFSGRSVTSKTTYVLARMWMVDEQDSVAFYDSLEIRGRGNSTWNMAKKPYKLKFHEKEKLLGKGYAKAKKWTLMPVGSKWELYIPQELAYGDRESGKIPPFSTLIFTVELLEIEK